MTTKLLSTKDNVVKFCSKKMENIAKNSKCVSNVSPNNKQELKKTILKEMLASYFEKVAMAVRDPGVNTYYITQMIGDINKALVSIYLDLEMIEEEGYAS